MKLIEPKVELITETDPFKKIEIAGRTCYKSEKNITDESSIKFYNNLVEHKHTAMLEHVSFLFEVTDENLYNRCCAFKYLNCTDIPVTTLHFDNTVTIYRQLVSGNLRAINECGIPELLETLFAYDKRLVYNSKFLEEVNSRLPYALDCSDKVTLVDLSDYVDLTEKELLNHKYITMRFTCDRGVTHELVRHRPFSFAQESTRYVNYAKNEMQFIEPADFNNWDARKQNYFIDSLTVAEIAYNKMISEFNAPPQEARALLPNAIKTEIVVTGNYVEWNHFFDLRYHGTTGKPHPDIKVIAEKAYNLITR